jgi:hypothetical protein
VVEPILQYLLFSGYEPGFYSESALPTNLVRFDRRQLPLYNDQLEFLNPTTEPLFGQPPQEHYLHRIYEVLLVQIDLWPTKSTEPVYFGNPLYLVDLYFDPTDGHARERF